MPCRKAFMRFMRDYNHYETSRVVYLTAAFVVGFIAAPLVIWFVIFLPELMEETYYNQLVEKKIGR